MFRPKSYFIWFYLVYLHPSVLDDHKSKDIQDKDSSEENIGSHKSSSIPAIEISLEKSGEAKQKQSEDDKCNDNPVGSLDMNS